MTGLGVRPKTPESLVRCSTTEPFRPISSIHLAPPPPYLVFALEDSHNKYKLILSELIKYKCLKRKVMASCVVGTVGRMNIYKETNENVWTWNRTQDPWITSQQFSTQLSSIKPIPLFLTNLLSWNSYKQVRIMINRGFVLFSF